MKKLLARVVPSYLAHGCMTRGASLAFYALFVLLPIPIFAMSIAAELLGDEVARREVLRLLTELGGRQMAATLSEALESGVVPVGWRGANLFALASLLFGSTVFFAELQDTLNVIWRVPSVSSGWRGYVRARLLSFLMVGASGAAILSLVLLSTLTREFGERLAKVVPIPMFLSRIEGTLFSLLVLALLFALVFRLVPDVRISWRQVWPGALLTAGLFLGGKELLALFFQRTPLATAYGAAGSLVLTLTWIYYSALAFLFGAELTRDLAALRGEVRPAASRSARA